MTTRHCVGLGAALAAGVVLSLCPAIAGAQAAKYTEIELEDIVDQLETDMNNLQKATEAFGAFIDSVQSGASENEITAKLDKANADCLAVAKRASEFGKVVDDFNAAITELATRNPADPNVKTEAERQAQRISQLGVALLNSKMTTAFKSSDKLNDFRDAWRQAVAQRLEEFAQVKKSIEDGSAVEQAELRELSNAANNIFALMSMNYTMILEIWETLSMVREERDSWNEVLEPINSALGGFGWTENFMKVEGNVQQNLDRMKDMSKKEFIERLLEATLPVGALRDMIMDAKQANLLAEQSRPVL